MRTLIAILALTTAAHAQEPQCASLPVISGGLLMQFGELAQADGTAFNGVHMLLFANEDAGTWTLVGLGSNGLACITSSGIRFKTLALPAKPSAPEAPT